MLSVVRDGKLAFGLEPARISCSIVNRVGSALVYGDCLMLDLENQSYDTDADEGGVFGNGITPATSTSGVGTLAYPLVLVVGGGATAAGTVVPCIAQGIQTNVMVTNNGTAAAGGNKGYGLRPVSTSRVLDLVNSSGSNRLCGIALSTHTTALTAESMTVFFDGLNSR